MDETKKSDSNSLSRKHFSKLHEKVQNKYAEMQRKLQKSKSMESVSSMSDEYVFKDQKNCENTIEEDYVFEETEKNTKSEVKVVKHNVIEENVEVNKHNATFQECYEYETTIFESVKATVGDSKEDKIFFGGDFTSNESESVQVPNIENVIVEEIAPPTPSPKISIREKIGTRISAARERRREVKDKKRESLQKVEKLILSNTTKLDISKKKTSIATLTVGLIEVTGSENELALDDKLYCRIRLGTDKRKSKSKPVKNQIIRYKIRKRVVEWQELYNFNISSDLDNILEITVWLKDKDEAVGRTIVDLATVEQEKTHRMLLNLAEEGSLQLFILLTITGTAPVPDLMDTFIDLKDYSEKQRKLDRMNQERYLHFLTSGLDDVGWLSVLVHGAKGLSHYDCCCVLQIGNDRLQTQTINRTNNPAWDKILSFKIKDITTILYIMVFDTKSKETCGELWIPLVKVKNGEKKWYALKNETLRERANGDNPRILLEMNLYYSIIKAAVGTLKPKERQYLDKESEFSRQVLAINIARIRVFIDWLFDAARIFTNTCLSPFIISSLLELAEKWKRMAPYWTDKTAVAKEYTDSTRCRYKEGCQLTCRCKKTNLKCTELCSCDGNMCFEWDSTTTNVISITLWVLFWCFCQPWWFPLMLIFPFIWYAPPNESILNWKIAILNAIEIKVPEVEVEEQAGLIARLYSLSDLLKKLQNEIGEAASALERLKNLFHCTVPLISGMVMIVILLLTLFVSVVPIRYMIMLWGVQKFVKKLVNKDRVPTNELAAVLSRIPDDETDVLKREKLPDNKLGHFLGRILDEETMIYCKELELLPLPPEDII